MDNHGVWIRVNTGNRAHYELRGQYCCLCGAETMWPEPASWDMPKCKKCLGMLEKKNAVKEGEGI